MPLIEEHSQEQPINEQLILYEKEIQKRSVMGTLYNNALSVFEATGLTLPVQLPKIEDTSPELNTEFVQPPYNVLLELGKRYFTKENFPNTNNLDIHWDATPPHLTHLSSITIDYKWLRDPTVATVVADYLERHTSTELSEILTEFDESIKKSWHLFSEIKHSNPQIAALIESLIPAEEAYKALIVDNIEEYTSLSGIEGLTSIQMGNIRMLLEQILDIDTVTQLEPEEVTVIGLNNAVIKRFAGQNFKETLEKLQSLISTAFEEKNEHFDSRIRKTEDELVAEKMKQTEHIPVSRDLKFAIQVIAYNEMPSASGVSYELPNLALQLRSIMNAIEEYKTNGKGKASEIEVLYNINNKPDAVPLGNIRSLTLLNGIIGNAPLEEVLQSFDWMPQQDKAHDGVNAKRVVFLRNFYTKLITDARKLIAEGFHIVPIDSTDGAFIARRGSEKKGETEVDIAEQTQGARRLLTSEVSVKRMQKARVKNQYFAAMDADVLLKPGYFTDHAKILDQMHPPGCITTSTRFKPMQGSFRADILRHTNERGIPVIETFSDDQLSLLQTYKDTSGETNTHIRWLYSNGFTESQVALLTTIRPEALEKICGYMPAHLDEKPFEGLSTAIPIFRNAEANLHKNRLFFYYLDLAGALSGLKNVNKKLASMNPLEKFGNTITSNGTYEWSGHTVGFLHTRLIHRDKYLRSEGWSIEKDSGEDSNFVGNIAREGSMYTYTYPQDEIRIRDRVRKESWMGGHLESRTNRNTLFFDEDDESEFKNMFNHIKQTFSLPDDYEITYANFPSIVWSKIVSERYLTLSRGEKKLLDTIKGRFSLAEIAKEGSSIPLLSLVELVRVISQEPRKYKHLVNFFAPMAAMVDNEKKATNTASTDSDATPTSQSSNTPEKQEEVSVPEDVSLETPVEEPQLA